MIANQRVGRVMTEAVLSIDVEESAGAVLRLFAGYPLHHLPVLNGQKVVGMLSSADVMKLEAFLPPYGWVSFDVSETQKLIATIKKDGKLSDKEKADLVTAASQRLTVAGTR